MTYMYTHDMQDPSRRMCASHHPDISESRVGGLLRLNYGYIYVGGAEEWLTCDGRVAVIFGYESEVSIIF